jgi:hypothetical protein
MASAATWSAWRPAVPGIGQWQRVFFLDKDTPDNRSGNNIFISTASAAAKP